METISEVVTKFHHNNVYPGPDEIFVFGSNVRGVHGKGAAKFALDHCGAIRGQGVGLQGRSYAIPTKDEHIQTLPVDSIIPYITEFKLFTLQNPSLNFIVSAVGTGLAGYEDIDIAPWFLGCSHNCIFPVQWADYLSYDRLKGLCGKYIS